MLGSRQFVASTAVVALVAGCTRGGAGLSPGGIRAAAASDPLVSELHRRSFRFFWNTTDPENGLAPDRWPTPSFASIAVGFTLAAYPIGVSNGWITREQARIRTLATLEFLAGAPQGDGRSSDSGYQGFFYHFLGVTVGHRFARCELSTVDTALLLGGVPFAQSWFDGDHPEEARIRSLAEQIHARVDWTWITPRAPFVSMGWHPESGFIPHDWDIYNEALLLYVLALGSLTHPLPPETWDAWTAAYAAANPGGWAGYDTEVWGLTACDGPGDFAQAISGQQRQFFSYSARGRATATTARSHPRQQPHPSRSSRSWRRRRSPQCTAVTVPASGASTASSMASTPR